MELASIRLEVLMLSLAKNYAYNFSNNELIFLKCNCNPGFTGAYCELFIQACLSNPCNMNNTLSCNNQLNKYICVCLPGKFLFVYRIQKCF